MTPCLETFHVKHLQRRPATAFGPLDLKEDDATGQDDDAVYKPAAPLASLTIRTVAPGIAPFSEKPPMVFTRTIKCASIGPSVFIQRP